jgi:hypothetical protein
VAPGNIAADRIEVSVAGLFSTRHRFDTPGGSLGELTVPAFGRRSAFRCAGGREMSIRRTSWMGNRYELNDGEEILATAWPRGPFRRAIDLDFQGSSYTLAPTGAFRQGWYLLDDQGIRWLEFQPRGAFRRGAYLQVLAPVPVELVVLFY